MTLRRLVLLEVLRPFAVWTALLCALQVGLAFVRGAEVLLGSAATASDLARLLFYLAPQFIVQSVPVAFLLGSLVGVGRLIEDSELKAMVSLGVTPRVVVQGPALLAVPVVGLMVVLHASWLPWGQRMVRATANEIIRNNLMRDLTPGVFHEEVNGLTLYVGSTDGRGGWRSVLVHDSRDLERPLLVLASRGAVRPAAQADGIELELQGGAVHRENTTTDEYAVASFERGHMWAGVQEAYHQQNRFGSARDEKPLAQLVGERRGADPPTLRALDADIGWRLGQMAMPLSFGVLGPAAALVRRRGGMGSGLFFTLAGYLAFYVVARTAIQLGEAGVGSPLVLGQLPNLLFLAVGALLTAWVVRRGP